MSPFSVPLAGLIILDGWALNPRAEGNAVMMARTPTMDELTRACPHRTLVRIAADAGIPRLRVHAILDGRDVPPRSARADLESTESVLREIGRGGIATVCGRYYAMDRDKRWERTELAYRAMVLGEGLKA